MTLKSTTIVGNGDKIGTRISRVENGKRITGYYSSRSDRTSPPPSTRNFIIEISGLANWWIKTYELLNKQGFNSEKRTLRDVRDEVVSELSVKVGSLNPKSKEHIECLLENTTCQIDKLLSDQNKIRIHKNQIRRKKAEVALPNWINEALTVGISPKEIEEILKLAVVQEVMVD